VAEWRLISDAGQVDEDDERWSYGFKMAFNDWRLYVFALIFLCIQVASATSNFFPAVVKTLGFSTVNTLLLTVPPYMLGLVVSIANNWSADRFQNSSFHAIWPMVVAIIGFVVAAATLNIGARYFAMVLMVAGGHGSNAVVLAWTQKTMLRPRIKRASAVAFVNAFGNISQVTAGWYQIPETILIICADILILLLPRLFCSTLCDCDVRKLGIFGRSDCPRPFYALHPSSGQQASRARRVFCDGGNERTESEGNCRCFGGGASCA
jgi:hypothetical protein